MSEDQRARAEGLRKFAHELGIRIQFATEGLSKARSSHGNAESTSEGWGTRFLREGAELLDILQEIPFPEVVHSLLETFEELVESSPPEVLQRIAAAVRTGIESAYQHESLGVGLAVTLVRRYLADHRRLLQEDRQCREALISILDTFVRAGWPAAMELTFRLDEIFR